jgi:hypothetical protein
VEGAARRVLQEGARSTEPGELGRAECWRHFEAALDRTGVLPAELQIAESVYVGRNGEASPHRIELDALLSVVGSAAGSKPRGNSWRQPRTMLAGAGALASFALLLTWLAPSIVRQGNLARSTRVEVSSLAPESPGEGSRLVDGDRTEIGLRTDHEGQPWVALDLGAVIALREVVVHNRKDCCQDVAVPLIVETSEDGRRFKELSTRKHEFAVWAVDGGRRKARHVRVRAKRKTELVLSEVEIY